MIRKWVIWRCWQIMIDFLGILLSFVLAYFVRVGWIFSSEFQITPYIYYAAMSSLVWSGLLVMGKLYRIPPKNNHWIIPEIIKILSAGIVGIGALVVSYFFQRELFFS